MFRKGKKVKSDLQSISRVVSRIGLGIGVAGALVMVPTVAMGGTTTVVDGANVVTINAGDDANFTGPTEDKISDVADLAAGNHDFIDAASVRIGKVTSAGIAVVTGAVGNTNAITLIESGANSIDFTAANSGVFNVKKLDIGAGFIKLNSNAVKVNEIVFSAGGVLRTGSNLVIGPFGIDGVTPTTINSTTKDDGAINIDETGVIHAKVGQTGRVGSLDGSSAHAGFFTFTDDVNVKDIDISDSGLKFTKGSHLGVGDSAANMNDGNVTIKAETLVTGDNVNSKLWLENVTLKIDAATAGGIDQQSNDDANGLITLKNATIEAQHAGGVAVTHANDKKGAYEILTGTSTIKGSIGANGGSAGLITINSTGGTAKLVVEHKDAAHKSEVEKLVFTSGAGVFETNGDFTFADAAAIVFAHADDTVVLNGDNAKLTVAALASGAGLGTFDIKDNGKLIITGGTTNTLNAIKAGYDGKTSEISGGDIKSLKGIQFQGTTDVDAGTVKVLDTMTVGADFTTGHGVLEITKNKDFKGDIKASDNGTVRVGTSGALSSTSEKTEFGKIGLTGAGNSLALLEIYGAGGAIFGDEVFVKEVNVKNAGGADPADVIDISSNVTVGTLNLNNFARIVEFKAATKALKIDEKVIGAGNTTVKDVSANNNKIELAAGATFGTAAERTLLIDRSANANELTLKGAGEDSIFYVKDVTVNDAGGVITLDNATLDATNFKFKNAGSTLKVLAGGVLKSAVDGNGGNEGKLDFQGSSKIVGQIGSTDTVAEMNITANKDSTVTLDTDVVKSLTIKSSIDNSGYVFTKDVAITTGNAIDLAAAGAFLDAGKSTVTITGGSVDTSVAGGVLKTTLTSNDASTQTVKAGKFAITGGASTLVNAQATTIKPTMGTGSVLEVGDNLFTVVTAAAVIGNQANLTLDDSGLGLSGTRFTKTIDFSTANTVKVKISKASVLDSTTGITGLADNAKNVAKALEGVLSKVAVDSSLAKFSAKLDTLDETKGAEATALMEQLNPAETNGGSNAAILQATNLVQDQAFQRTSQVFNVASLPAHAVAATGMNAGDDMGAGRAVWAKAFGNTTRQGKLDGVEGFKADTTGLAFGGDYLCSDDKLVGAGFAYAHTKVKDKSANEGLSKIDSYTFMVYGSYSPEKYFVDGVFSVGFNKNKISRKIALTGETPKADYRSTNPAVKVKAGYDIIKNGDGADSFAVTPMVSYELGRLANKSYDESGAANGAHLKNVKSNSQTTNEFGVGVRLSGTSTGDEFTFMPEVHVMALHNFGAKKVVTSSTFAAGGSSFDTNGAKPKRTTYNIGASLTLVSTENVYVTGAYDYATKSKYKSHTGSLTVRYVF